MGIEVKPNSSLQSMEYTYNENGNTYKVVEKANKDLISVKSDIYLQDISGQYVLESSTTTDVNKDDIIVTKKEHGKTTRDTIKIDREYNCRICSKCRGTSIC